MADHTATGRATLISGTVASVTSTLALMILARASGQGALQPTNATSHWLHGREAARLRRADLSHTGVGYATHHAATIFWAWPFQAWQAAQAPRRPALVMRDAVVLAAIAAAVDYTVTPKRFTPGWEFVLSKRKMAVAYGAMAVGLAAGAWLQRTHAAPLPDR